MRELYGLLKRAEVDMTLFFRRLADVPLDRPVLDPLHEAFYDESKREGARTGFDDWLSRYAARARQDAADPAERRARMHAVNPRYVLRNYLAQLAIDRSEGGTTAACTSCWR